ncbi:MAG: hypothetical protein NT096_00670 [Proteobacteria bacterium]|nr:hypothetical protein [Pseudomonadota bacterium]
MVMLDSFIRHFVKKMTRLRLKKSKRGLIEEVEGAHGEFGLVKSNPIPVAWGPSGEYGYLSRLRCPCSEPFFFHRVGSCGPGPDGHVVDLFELICRQHVHRYRLYLDMYHSVLSTKAPEGLQLSSPEGVGTTSYIGDLARMTFEQMEDLVTRQK